MFKIQDFNPVFKTPTSSSSNGQPTNNVANSTGLNASHHGINHHNFVSNNMNSSNASMSYASQSNLNNPSTPQSNNFGHLFNEEKVLTYTNYYKFCCLSNINCYFYQFDTQSSKQGNSNGSAAPSSASSTSSGATSSTSQTTIGITYEVLQYEQLIKHKLKHDYQINDILTWIAKKELCVFQLKSDDQQDENSTDIGFNQLKDAMSNIISENNISLKLISASTFDANKLFSSTFNGTAQNQMQKKSLNVIYLSFLRAVHKYILQKMASSHTLFDATNQSLSIDIFPFSGHLLTSSLIQRSLTTAPVNKDTKKHKILKKLVPYSILKINPSLNQKNELIVNMTSLKKVFYKFTDYLTVSCNNNIAMLDEYSSFAIYIAPSGLRCLTAGETYADSITDEMPESHERLFKILEKFNDIDIINNPTLIGGKRLWIKIHPSGFSSGSMGPLISNYLDNNLSTGKKYIYWPLELCFIQFASDCTPGKPQPKSAGNDHFSIDDPFALMDEFIDVVDELNHSRVVDGNEIRTEPADESITGNKPDFKLPESFEFSTNMDSPGNQMKPLTNINDIHGFPEPMKTGDEFEDLFHSNTNKFSTDHDFQQNFETEPTGFSDADPSANMSHIEMPDKKIEDFEDEWDDLFGDSNEGEEDSLPTAGMKSETMEKSDLEMYDIDQVIDDAIEDLEDELIAEKNETNGEAVTALLKSASIDVESNTATLMEAHSGTTTTPFYQDPGAPSPLPFQIFTPETQSKKDHKSASTNDSLKVIPNINNIVDTKKSIFSPLNFNPLIEKDIDSKYSNGGKFFVRKESIAADDISDAALQTSNLGGLDAKPSRRMSFMTPTLNIQGFQRNSAFDLKPVDDLFSDSEEDDDDDGKDARDDFDPNKSTATDGNLLGNNQVDPGYRKTDTVNIYDDEFGSGLLYNSGKKHNLIEPSNIYDYSNADTSFNGNLFKSVEESHDSGHMYESFNNNLNEKLPEKTPHEPVGLGLGLPTGTAEVNPLKRRKLENIFDNIGIEDDDDDVIEFDLEEEIEPGKNDADLISANNQNHATSNNESNEQTLVSFSSSRIDQNISAIESVEIPNSWFYVLRLIAPIQIPFNFLALTTMQIPRQRISNLLPILQEFVMFSQKYMNNHSLDMLIRNRDCPSVLDSDVEYLLYKLFPGINKVYCHELLEADTDTREQKPYECLFGSHVPEPQVEVKKSDNNKYFEDDGYNVYSPMLNGENPNQITDVENVVDDFKKLDFGDSIPEDNLFRLKSPMVNLKRSNQSILVNKVGLDYWRILNLEPLSRKNFKMLFVVPKSNTNFSNAAQSFYKYIMECYADCKLGTIESAKEIGIVEVECEITGDKNTYWNYAQKTLLATVDEIQSQFRYENINKILLMFIDPFQDLESLVKMAKVASNFETALAEKTILDTDLKKRKKRKNKLFTKLPVMLFYKAISVDLFYMNEEGQRVIFTKENYVDFCLEVYNHCPNENSTDLKDRHSIFAIEKEIQDTIEFNVPKKQISRPLVENEVFLHLCYERSIDKKWCVASWVDQTGSVNYTKSWYIDGTIEQSKSFEKVADDIMGITTNYVSSFKKRTFVVLSRLNNIIPDDELAEWKRLSIKNNNILLIVMTAELESSTLILSNNPGVLPVMKTKEEPSKDPGYTIASTTSQSQTPAHMMNNSSTLPYHVVGSTRFESPDISLYTPSYDIGLSPLDAGSTQLQTSIQTLQPLHEEALNDSGPATPVLVDISDECYGLIFQVAQPLSNQPRIPLKTGFLVATGENAVKNQIIEINLLSCQAGMSSTKFMKKLLAQYRNLGVIAPYWGMTGIDRKCGNVEFDDTLDEDDEDENYSFEDKFADSSIGVNSNQLLNHEKSTKRKERLNLQHQYMQFHKMQLRQKRHKLRGKEKSNDEVRKNVKGNIIPVHMLAVRKMLDFLVNIKVE